MNTETACLRCGNRSPGGAQFCALCGLRIAPAGVTLPVAQAAPPWASPPPPPAPYPAQTAAKPFGIVALVAVEVVVAIVGLLVVRDFYYSADYRFTYEEWNWGLIDGTLGVIYLITSVYGLLIASWLWGLQPRAWRPAILLSVGLIALDVMSIVLWGATGLDILGLTVHACMIWYLNQSQVRAVFGRPPGTFL